MTASAQGELAFRVAVVCAMVGCVAVSMVALIDMMAPHWDGTILIAFCMGTVIEAFATFTLYRRQGLGIHRIGSGRLQAIELAAIYLVLQLCVDFQDGTAPFRDYFPHLDGKTLGLFVPVFFIWLISTDIARDFDRVGAPAQGILAQVPVERRLSTRYFAGGVLLFILCGVTQMRIASVLKLPVPNSSGPVANVVLYFLLGIILLGHVRYTVLRGRWQLRDIAMVPGMGTRWMGYILAFVVLVGVLAFLLPTSGTLGLLDVGRAIWSPISAVLVQIILAIRGPLTWLLRLFGGNAPVPRPRVIPRHLPPHFKLPPQHTAPKHGGTGNAGAVLKSLVFWIAVLAAVLYLARNATSRRLKRVPFIGNMLAAVRNAIAGAWTSMRRWIRRNARTVTNRIPGATLARTIPSMMPSVHLPFGRSGSLSSREQVLRYYLNVVDRAQRQGVNRRASQTPYEFSADLVPHLADASQDMRSLTDAFVEARYSRHTVSATEAGQTRTSWQRVKAALRRIRSH